jgi:hypothetical protein
MIAALASLWQVYVAKQALSKKLLRLDKSQFDACRLFKTPYLPVNGSRAIKKNEVFVVDDGDRAQSEAAGRVNLFNYVAA